MLKICVLTLFTLTAAAANCAGAANEGASGAQFLRIGVGAKAAALGEAGAAMSGVQALFYNPAGLAGVTGPEVYLSHAKWILDTNYSNLAFATKLGGGAFGLAASYLSNPATDKYDKFGTKLSEKYSATDMAIALGYSHKLAGNTDFGLNVKRISSKLDTESATALAADFGIKCAAVPGKFEFGLVMQNAGGKLNYINEGDPLPRNLKLGGQYTVNLDNNAATKKDVTILLDVNSMKDSGPYANLGVDLLTVYDRKSNFSMRIGYRTNAGKSAGVSGGLGLDMKTYLVDYAYAPMGNLGNTHRFSLTFKFSAQAGDPEQE